MTAASHSEASQIRDIGLLPACRHSIVIACARSCECTLSELKWPAGYPCLYRRKVERALNASPIGWYAIALPPCTVLPCEWPLLAGLSAIPKYQRGVVELESRQDRFVALGGY